MDTSVRRRLLWLATLLLVAGLAAGFWPLSSQGAKCGTAYVNGRTSVDAEIDSLRADVGVPAEANDCDGARSTWRTVSVVLLVAGGVLLAGGWVAAGAGRPRRDDDG